MDKTILDKINKFTRRKLTEDEVYVFSVILCDNDIDRDCERFSEEALEELKERFIGKTGIFDHEATTVNQNARIFDTELITDSSRSTAYGKPYSKRLLRDYFQLCSDLLYPKTFIFSSFSSGEDVI